MLKNVTYISKIGDYILNGVSFKLYEAERIGLLCELGSGKDFLINLLMTLIQRTDLPANGPSSFEVMGKPVNLSTSSELRKNMMKLSQLIKTEAFSGQQMMFLYAKPSLLMGTVRANIDPFSKYSDEEIIRTLHFLKIIKALQTYSSLTECDQIWLFLAHKTSQVDLTEINLDELKRRIDKKEEKTKKVEDPNKKKKDANKSKMDKTRSGTSFGFASEKFGGIKNSNNEVDSPLPPLKGLLNKSVGLGVSGKPPGTNIKDPNEGKKNQLLVPGSAADKQDPAAGADKTEENAADGEAGDEENEQDKEEEPINNS